MFGRYGDRSGRFGGGGNPYRRGGTAGGRTRRQSAQLTWKQQFFGIGLTMAAIGVWYATPVSEWVTDIVLEQIPIEEDIKLGYASKQQFKYPTVYDPHWTPTIQSIGNDLVRTHRNNNNRRRDDYYQWDFAIIDADTINAFALPGGTVRVTKRLLDTLQLTHGEIAALLGHEMGHVVHRHSQARMLQHQLLQRIIQALVYEDNDGVQETFGQALGELLTNSASWLGEQKFSRRDEYQADAKSWDLLLEGKYSPKSLHSLLSKLHKLEGGRHATSENPKDPLAVRKVMEWSQTHPATKDRLHALQEKWDGMPAKDKRRLSKIPI